MDRIIKEINAQGDPVIIEAVLRYISKQLLMVHHDDVAERLPNAKVLGKTSIMLLVHPTLTDVEIHKSSDVLRNVALVAPRRS